MKHNQHGQSAQPQDQVAISCRRAAIAINDLLGQEIMGEPFTDKVKRSDKVSRLKEGGEEYAKTVDPDFCDQHCRGEGDCDFVTGNSVHISYNERLRKGKLAKDNEKLAEAEEIYAGTSTTPSCPFMAYPDQYSLMLDDLKRGANPDVMAQLGIGSEPSPLGGPNLASDIDVEGLEEQRANQKACQGVLLT